MPRREKPVGKEGWTWEEIESGRRFSAEDKLAGRKKSPEKSPDPRVVTAEMHLVLPPVKAQATGQFRMNLAAHQLLAAALFSRRVAEIEGENAGQEFGPFYDEVLWNAMACVTGAVCCLEAYVNEFYIDRKTHFPNLKEPVADRFWELFEMKPILEKYELALLLMNKKSLERGAEPSQSVQALVDLRNALTHFKPEWSDEKDAHKKVSKQLRYRFPENPFLPGKDDRFPMKWATHGCTVWAVRTCLDFISAFEKAADIEPRFKKHLAKMTP